MRSINTYLIIISIFVFFMSCKTQDEKLTDFVDPFIGTGGHGHTYPGATLPFGMVQLSPDTRLTGWDGCSAYHYSDSIIYGFSHTHLSGTGVSDYGDILLMPYTGETSRKSGYIDENNKTNEGYGSVFYKKDETAHPGYYSVFLSDYKIKAELSASLRCGIHRYTFPESDQQLLIDLQHRDKVLDSELQIINNTEIAGYRISSAWSKEQYVYFYMKFSKPYKSLQVVLNDSTVEQKNRVTGKNIKAAFSFNDPENKELIVKVGISAVSIKGAKKNLEKEIPDFDFDKVKKTADSIWNNELKRIEIETDNNEHKKIFYTALYHSLLAPNLFMDVDGKYRGTDLKIHQANDFTNYTVFSLWDTYRAAHPLYTILYKNRTNDFIKTFLNQYKNGGQLPVWELAGYYTGCMIGYHSVPVIADAYLKGINDYDAELAFKAMKHSAEQDHLGLNEYRKFGYIPQNKEHESVSKQLEYAFDDWCIAQMAKKLNKTEDYKKYMHRAQYYKNLFEPETKFMRAKTNGQWIEPFEPSEVNFSFTEANSWQYSFYVPQDIKGLIQLMGGNEAFDKKLDELFTSSTKTKGRKQPDITGLIGQYAHGNEPSHHMAYLYNYIGKPWKTQEKIKQILNQMYNTEPDGLIGNEDCGQMSAWYVLSAMGFYPVNPADGYYIIGYPLFDKVTIHLENGKRFVIQRKNNGDYIESVTLNNNSLNNSFIKHTDILRGGNISFTMDDKKSDWGTQKEHIPVSEITEHLICPAPYVNNKENTFNDSILIELKCIDKNANLFYTLNDTNSKFIKYQNPFVIKDNAKILFYAQNPSGEKSKIIYNNFVKIDKNRKIELLTEFSPQYSAGGKNALIDGKIGDSDFRLGTWQGYWGNNLEAIVDLSKIKNINEIKIRFLQDINAWVFMPKKVVFYTSNDGNSYKKAGVVNNTVTTNDWDVQIKEFMLKKTLKARYIKIIAENIGKCPPNHKASGEDAWIFADEILIDTK